MTDCSQAFNETYHAQCYGTLQPINVRMSQWSYHLNLQNVLLCSNMLFLSDQVTNADAEMLYQVIC